MLLLVLLIIAALANGDVHKSSQVPIIDVSSFHGGSDSAKRNIADAVSHAFAEFGFAVITGHNVRDQLFEDAYDAGKDFFHQPIAEKGRFDLGKGYGYGGYLNKMESGGQLTGKRANHSDGVESLTLRGLQHVVASEDVCGFSTGKARFAQDMSDVPHADAIPCLPPALRPSVMKLHAALYDLKATMTTLTELALGATPGDFFHIFDPTKGAVRFAYYPEMSDAPVERSIDYGAHADSGSMVFLRLDHNNPTGTQVLYKGKWLSVPHVPGGIVMNLGTVLSRLTGGRWHAAVHRASRVGRSERMSIVLGAMVPRNDLILECLPHICPVKADQLRQVSVKEYLDARVRLQRPEKDPHDQDVVSFVDSLL